MATSVISLIKDEERQYLIVLLLPELEVLQRHGLNFDGVRTESIFFLYAVFVKNLETEDGFVIWENNMKCRRLLRGFRKQSNLTTYF